MALGLGITTPATPFAPPSSGNPVWDEIQQAHSSLSPAAQRAVQLSGIPQRAAEAEAPAPMPGAESAAPIEAPAAPRPIASPSSLNVRGLGSPKPATSPDAAAHVAELNRVTAPPLPTQIPRIGAGGEFQRMQANPLAHTSADTGRSGIGQIHNPFLRGLARVGDVVGSAFLPNLTAMIPGTELHHRATVAENEGIVGADTEGAKKEADTVESGARAASLEATAAGEPSQEALRNAQADEATARAESLRNPPEKQGDPTKTIETAKGIMQFNPESGKYDIPVGEAPGKNAMQHVMTPDGSVVALEHDAKTGKVVASVVYKSDPKVETEMADLLIGGKLHKVLTNKRTGEAIKDLGETRQPSAGGDHGVTMIGPDGKVLRLQPGDTAPGGATTPTQAGSLNVPTAATRTMAEKAPRVLNFVDRINQLLDENEKNLGPLASRWQEFTAGKVGVPNKGYTQLRTDLGLLNTALMNMHVGARGGEKIMEHFASMIDGSRQSPENLRAALGEIKAYAEEVAKENKRGAGAAAGEGAASTGSGGDMINVQMPDGRVGPIHRSQKDKFLKDNPGSKVVQ